uniref:Legumain prodomain domain-containing protein n=1 Tax=Medicago truncatula TaxID=3880 RepID=A7UQU2_MEDTR|nr:hypothetical protein MtrDRAFT_AC168204g21v2 [Medicago truncatula]
MGRPWHYACLYAPSAFLYFSSAFAFSLYLLVNIYERRCGILSTYGLKYSRAFANMYNVGISKEQMIAATSKVCPEKKHFS